MSDMFKFAHNNTYSLSSNDRKLYLEKPNTEFMKKSFSYRGGASSWNDLQDEFVKTSFKTNLNNYCNISNRASH